MALCAACAAESLRWLDTRPSMFRGPRIASHAEYDDTNRGIEENRRLRHEEWARLVHFQQGLIREQCARDHAHGQLSFFEVAA